MPEALWRLYTDGASRGNPGPAGAGWVLEDPSGVPVQRGGAFLGRRTNNEAEYEAVIRGLAVARDAGVQHLILRADSELLVRQLTGVYRVRHPRMQPLFAKAKELLGAFADVRIEHVRRHLNQLADAEANLAIDRKG